MLTMNRLSVFWSTDRSLSVFLGLLLVAVFIVLPLEEQEGTLIASVGFSVLLVAGVALVAKNRMTRGLVAGAAGVALTYSLDSARHAGHGPLHDERLFVALFSYDPCGRRLS